MKKQETKIIIGFALFVLLGVCAKLAFAIPREKAEEKNSQFKAEVVTPVNQEMQVQSSQSELLSKTEINIEPPKEKTDAKKFPDNLAVESAVAVDLDTGEKYFTLNESKRWPIASLSKVMTATIALENYKLDDKIVMSETAADAYGAAGDFHAGETYTVQDLITSMMVVSSNKAAVALSENMEGNNFIDLMNKKAQDLGMVNTYYNEPSGMSSLNQSSLSDLMLLVKYTWQNHPEIFAASDKTKASITEINTGKSRTLVNINQLVQNPNFIGGKTGFTDDARQNLISTFSINNRRIVIMIFGAEDRITEAKKILTFLVEKQKSDNDKTKNN